MEDRSRAPSVDIQASLDYLKDVITIHFKNLQDVDSSFGHHHATNLKDHINHVATVLSKSKDASDSLDSTPLTRLPRAISRFAPRATINPGLNWGLFGKLPRELRDIIYNAVLLSHDCHINTYIEACTCTQESRRSQSGLALLRTCAKIHNEALPLIYAPETFALVMGVADAVTALEGGPLPEWQDPQFYRETLLGQQLISRAPHHVFRLIQSLYLTFTTEAIMWSDERLSMRMADQLLRHLGQEIKQVCSLLRDEAVALQNLDIVISIYLPWDLLTNGDTVQHDYKAVVYQLLEPLLQLRDIPNTIISLHGFEALRESSPVPWPDVPEPRWELTDEFMAYMGSVLESTRDTIIPGFREGKIDDSEILEDDYEDEEVINEWIAGHEDEEAFMQRYLRDVYGTDDPEALHGGMPNRWHVWLNSDHEKGCDWLDLYVEDEDDEST